MTEERKVELTAPKRKKAEAKVYYYSKSAKACLSLQRIKHASADSIVGACRAHLEQCMANKEFDRLPHDPLTAIRAVSYALGIAHARISEMNLELYSLKRPRSILNRISCWLNF